MEDFVALLGRLAAEARAELEESFDRARRNAFIPTMDAESLKNLVQEKGPREWSPRDRRKVVEVR